jgi:ubiquinone/menaquinone biosynthesis C-methylase UbiE
MEDNAIVVEAWNTVLFDKFSRFRHLLTVGLGAHSDEVLSRKPYAQGSRVLDVGCGFGDSTLRLARELGPSGHAVGVDCSERFVAEGRIDARAQHVDNATFFVADVQTEDLRGPYDHAFARFGTMFFNTPGAALRNLRKVVRPGGTLTQIVWRKREENPWLHDAELCVRALVPVVSHEETDAVHCGPGPFSMAGPDMVSGMLRSAGWNRISFERFDADICIGRDVEEAIAFAMALGPAGEIMRLAGEEGVRLEPQVMAALRETLERYVTKDGSVYAPSSTWFIRATNPS